MCIVPILRKKESRKTKRKHPCMSHLDHYRNIRNATQVESAITVITFEPASKVFFVQSSMQKSLTGQYNAKWPIQKLRLCPTTANRELWILRRERLYEYEIFSKNNSKLTQTSVILAGKTWYRRHFSSRLCKNVVVLKQGKITVAVLPFFDQQEGSVTSNKNNWATYSAYKE